MHLIKDLGEVRGIFLDISKVFDKVWHVGLIFKLRQNGISGDIINILRDFLCNKKQSSFEWSVFILG